MSDEDKGVGVFWKEVSVNGSDAGEYILDLSNKNMAGGKYSGENFANVNFSMTNLEGADLSGADLSGCDFTGANLKGANLSGSNMSGVNLSAAQLANANFTRANLNSAKFVDSDIQDAILNEIEIDDLGIENLQELIEYLAKYYPEKLNLRRLNLILLDLSRIDLSRVSLRGVDLRGCSLKGVKIWELDLSECIITPAQIAEALGRIPTPEEMKKLLAPKKTKEGGGKNVGIDFGGILYDDGREFGVIDAVKDRGIDIEDVVRFGKKVKRVFAKKPQKKDEAALNRIKSEGDNLDKQKIREIIEERKKQELDKMAAKINEKQEQVKEDRSDHKKKKIDRDMMSVYRGDREI